MEDKVSVGCCIANGVRINIPDGVRTIASYELQGPRPNCNLVAASVHPPANAQFTEIPAAHFEAWLEANRDTPMVTSGSVFRASA